MQVNAINNLSFTSRQHRPQKRQAAIEAEQKKQIYEQCLNDIPNNKKGSPTKVLMLLIGLAPAVAAGLQSCDKDAYAYAEAHATAICDCCHPHIIHGGDTVYVHDSIPVYIPQHDTVYIKENYESPVIDTLKAILHDYDIDLGDGYVPVSVSFVDEMDTRYRKQLFDGQSSSRDVVFYDAKRYPWDDIQGQFVIDDNLADREKYMLSLTNNGELYISRLVPKAGVYSPQSLSDYRLTDKAYKLTRSNLPYVMNKLVENNQDGVFVPDGTIEKGDMPQSLMLTNPYGTNWRWTNFNVQSMDVPGKK